VCILFNWLDYCGKYEGEAEIWAYDDDARRFTAFDESVNDGYDYFVRTYINYNEACCCNVVFDGDIIAAFVFISRNNVYPYEAALSRLNLRL